MMKPITEHTTHRLPFPYFLEGVKMITEARIYWDSQDCDNEGWAYRLRSHDGHEESGEYEPHASIEGNNGQLEVELVALLWRHDVDDTAGGICSDSHNELYAEWTRNEEGA